MLLFYKNKVLIKNKNYDFDPSFVKSQGRFEFLNTSESLPAVWQALTPWADLKEIKNLEQDEELITLRELLLICDEDSMRMTSSAFQFMSWFRNIKFCSRCGGILSPSELDYGRKCDSCGAMFYAPISPAVIIAIERDGKLLLAHNTAWPETRYSIIAGFVEPGERIEDTVRREIREEVSIEVKNLKYWNSQTWPFPNSLMLGFTAEYDSGEVKPDGLEISDAGFFSPEEIRRMNIPDRASIARKLIENFLTKFN